MWPFKKKEAPEPSYFVITGNHRGVRTSVTLWALDYDDAAHQFRATFPRHWNRVTEVRKMDWWGE